VAVDGEGVLFWAGVGMEDGGYPYCLLVPSYCLM